MTTPPIAHPPRRLPFFAAMVIRNSIPGLQVSWLGFLLLLYFLPFWLLIGLALFVFEDNSLLEKGFGVLLTVGSGLLFFLILSRLIKKQREGARLVKLIKEGIAVYGTLLEMGEEASERPPSAELSYSEIFRLAGLNQEEEKVAGRHEPAIYFDEDGLFEFQTVAGTTHRVKGRIEPFERVKLDHGSQPLILYLPDDPSQAVVYHSIKNAPEILPDGRLTPVSFWKSYMLVLPALGMLPFVIIAVGMLLILIFYVIVSMGNLVIRLL